jgi:peptide/nickel transport system substrate-binding protein
MRLRRLAAVLIFTVVSASLAQGALDPKTGGTLNVGLHLPFPTLDWQSTVGHPLPHAMILVYEGLFAFGSDFDAVPELVDTYEVSSDGRAWTFRLRQGVRFHDGTELGSNDVVASLERWTRIGPKGSALAGVERYEIVDDYTVTLHFGEPVGRSLLLSLGSDENKAVIMPEEIAEASQTAGVLTAVIGTGPYRFVEYRDDQYLKLVRFDEYSARSDAPNYQGGRKVAHLDEIIFWIVPEDSTRVAGLEAGDFDVITDVPDSEYVRLAAAPTLDPVKNGPGLLAYMMFNHKRGPTSNIEIRRAIQAAIDTDELSAAAVSNPEFTISNPSFFPPESAYNTDVRSELYNQGDPERARAILADFGYAGEEVVIQVIATNPLQNRLAVVFVEQMQRAGLNAVIQSYDLATWVAKRRDPDALNIYTSAGYWIDPSLWQAEFSGTFPSPEVGFQSEATDRIFAALARESEFDARYELGRQLQMEFYDQVATINLGFIYRMVAKNSSVIDTEGNLALGNLTLHNVWLNR